jgi:hypothetical protein
VDSALDFRYSTVGEELIDGTVRGLRISDMLGLAAASGGADSLQCPAKAHLLIGMLGNRHILTFHHEGDVGELGFLEAFHESTVWVWIDGVGRVFGLAGTPVGG